jgi:hypothetical protein
VGGARGILPPFFYAFRGAAERAAKQIDKFVCARNAANKRTVSRSDLSRDIALN